MDGCSMMAYWRGLCRRHYIADQYRDTPIPAAELLMEQLAKKIEVWDCGCWVWTKAKFARSNHGMFGYNALGKNFTHYVHRWVYEHLIGPVPEGLVLDHLCRVEACCNPDHLEPVSNAENIRRGIGPDGGLRRHQRACKRGHRFSPENTYVSKLGWRHCKVCARDRHRRTAKRAQ